MPMHTATRPSATRSATSRGTSVRLRLPNLERLGLGSLDADSRRRARYPQPRARVARLRERSRGKDTITGHWEMMGILTAVPFPDLSERLSGRGRRRVRADRRQAAARQHAGLGYRDHRRAGCRRTWRPGARSSIRRPIRSFKSRRTKTSCRCCGSTTGASRPREMLRPPHNVNRVIARPFVGEPGAFRRTPNRRDYAIEPPPNLLDELRTGECRGTRSREDRRHLLRSRRSRRPFASPITAKRWRGRYSCWTDVDHGFIFTNLNDFDSKYGHRRDVRGYASRARRARRHAPGAGGTLAHPRRADRYRRSRLRPDGTGHRPYPRIRPLPPSRAPAAGGMLGDIEGLDVRRANRQAGAPA